MGTNWPSRQEWTRILLEATVLFILGVLLGLTVNYQVAMKVLTGEVAAPVSSSVSGEAEEAAQLPEPIALEEVRELLEQNALAVDARTREAYREAHIPEAVSLPFVDYNEHKDDFFAAVDRDRTLIVYCSGYGCPDSFDLGMRLLEDGYRDVRLFEGGLPEWRDAGLEVEGGGA